MFVAVAGGSLGLLAGGVLTQALSWHWIFFVNLPIGAATIALGRSLIPADAPRVCTGRVDWMGSILVTASLMTAIYAIVQAGSTAGPRAACSDRRARRGADDRLRADRAPDREPDHAAADPAPPRARDTSVVRGFLVIGMYSTFFLGTLYLEHVRHYSALQTGLAFLPWTLTVGALSLGSTARLVERFGPFHVLLAGMVTVIAGLGLLTTAGADTSFFPTVFAAYLLIGLGIGSAFMPLLSIAMADVPAADAGLGSGIVNVSQQIAGALGLAVLGTIATNRTETLRAAQHPLTDSLLGGYHLAFVIGAGSVAAGVVGALVLLRPRRAPEPELAPAPARELERLAA